MMLDVRLGQYNIEAVFVIGFACLLRLLSISSRLIIL